MPTQHPDMTDSSPRRSDDDVRAALVSLERLAPTCDPRVALALGEELASSALPLPALVLLSRYYLPEEKRGSTDAVWDWWRENESDLRRRAGELP